MSLLTDLLTFVGFLAIVFGTAGTISKWIRENEERKQTAARNHREAMDALSRIEDSLNEPKS